MKNKPLQVRPYVLSIAGYDPSGGAGVLADVKTFEAIGVNGLAVTTCITYQNDTKFDGLHWLSKKKIKNQLYPLLEAYKIKYVKIGLIKNLVVMSELIELLATFNKDIVITWDPVLQATAGFTFHKKLSRKYLLHLYKHIHMITPNWEEIQIISEETDPIHAAKKVSRYCNVFLKGGHHTADIGTDMVWVDQELHALKPESKLTSSRHGTGCVLSAALTAYLALGNTMLRSCELAKAYTYKYIREAQ